MNYLFIGYTDKSKTIIDLILRVGKKDSIYIYSDEPIYELQKNVDFVKHDTFKDKLPDFVFIDVPVYYEEAWQDVVTSWGCKSACIGDR